MKVIPKPPPRIWKRIDRLGCLAMAFWFAVFWIRPDLYPVVFLLGVPTGFACNAVTNRRRAARIRRGETGWFRGLSRRDKVLWILAFGAVGIAWFWLAIAASPIAVFGLGFMAGGVLAMGVFHDDIWTFRQRWRYLYAPRPDRAPAPMSPRRIVDPGRPDQV